MVDTVTVPFRASAHGGFADVIGLLRVDEEGLSIEYEIMDAITGVLRSNHDVTIPISQLDEVTYHGGLFGAKIWIRTREMSSVSSVPWRHGAEVVVKIRRRDRKAAERFAEDCGWLVDT